MLYALRPAKQSLMGLKAIMSKSILVTHNVPCVGYCRLSNEDMPTVAEKRHLS